MKSGTAPLQQTIKCTVYGDTNIGKRRDVNQDALWYTDYNERHGVSILLVADGVGGNLPHGEHASKAAVEGFRDTFSQTEPLSELLSRIEIAIQGAQDNVLTTAEELNVDRIGTTMVGLVIEDRRAIGFNIGDSRLYRFREGEVELVSLDQTRLTDSGILRNELEKRNSRINSYLGQPKAIQAYYYELEVKEGDRFLLCSDGLWSLAKDHEIQQLVVPQQSLQPIVNELIDLALDRGAPDNVTVLMAQAGRTTPLVLGRLTTAASPPWLLFGLVLLVGVLIGGGAGFVVGGGLDSDDSDSDNGDTSDVVAVADDPTVTDAPTSTLEPPTATGTDSLPTAEEPTATNLPPITLTPTMTATASDTPTQTLTPSITFTPSITPIPTQTDTLTPSNTPTASETSTPTDTYTPTPTPTDTNTPTATSTPLPTDTSTPTITPFTRVTETEVAAVPAGDPGNAVVTVVNAASADPACEQAFMAEGLRNPLFSTIPPTTFPFNASDGRRYTLLLEPDTQIFPDNPAADGVTAFLRDQLNQSPIFQTTELTLVRVLAAEEPGANLDTVYRVEYTNNGVPNIGVIALPRQQFIISARNGLRARQQPGNTESTLQGADGQPITMDTNTTIDIIALADEYVPAVTLETSAVAGSEAAIAWLAGYPQGLGQPVWFASRDAVEPLGNFDALELRKVPYANFVSAPFLFERYSWKFEGQTVCAVQQLDRRVVSYFVLTPEGALQNTGTRPGTVGISIDPYCNMLPITPENCNDTDFEGSRRAFLILGTYLNPENNIRWYYVKSHGLPNPVWLPESRIRTLGNQSVRFDVLPVLVVETMSQPTITPVPPTQTPTATAINSASVTPQSTTLFNPTEGSKPTMSTDTVVPTATLVSPTIPGDTPNP